MTREEILAIQPGRELDALVVDKVMRWEKVDEGRMSEPLYTWYHTKDGVRYDVTAKVWTFRPSTDISAAWEVVEKLLEYNRRICLSNYLDGDWAVSVRDGGGGYTVGEMVFDSAPKAIVKAALLAVMDV